MPPSRPQKSVQQVDIDRRAAHAVEKGHPWIWRTAVRKASPSIPCGAVVMLTAGDQFVGYGLWDPASALAARVYGRERGHVLDLAMLVSNLARAVDARDGLLDMEGTTAYRLCNGEGDRVPGVVLDRYGPIVIARFDGDAIAVWAEDLLRAIWPHLAERGVTTLALRGSRRGNASLTTIAGDPVPPRVTVIEHGMRMVVDLIHGQKTGAFLDQRENRRRVRWMSAGARVLNLFSYTGGFSCAAALGGARHVTSVDIAHPAHAVAQENFRLNGLDPAAHTFVTADVFAYLEGATQRNDHFDVVISDPPSFAPNEKSLPRALAAYRRLHEACARVVGRGGTLCAASCSSHVDLDAFLGTLDDVVLAHRNFRMLEVFGQPPDHPTLPGWPEGRYLKFVVLGESLRPLTLRLAG